MKRVLFVDDEPQVLQGLRASLYSRRKQWDMQFAEGGAKALELIKASHFDVLVTDLRMPGVDGATLVARARADSPDTIRIVLSGYADEEQSQRLVSLAHRYLSKPCEPKRLGGVYRALYRHAVAHTIGSRCAPSWDRLAHCRRCRTLSRLCSARLLTRSVDSGKVAAIIQRDPAVSAKVLQVCNSAFFRLPRRVSSVQQAVSYLGLLHGPQHGAVRGAVQSGQRAFWRV